MPDTDEVKVLSPEDAARLEAKWNADGPLGMAPDADVPETRFQVLHGRVYTLQHFASGGSARGETTLDELERITGVKITKDGWYLPDGTYLANDPGLDAP